nr:hypothetical protein GCM10017745_11490 [Saccharothrix mutabilis subsp. capreolus]
MVARVGRSVWGAGWARAEWAGLEWAGAGGAGWAGCWVGGLLGDRGLGLAGSLACVGCRCGVVGGGVRVRLPCAVPPPLLYGNVRRSLKVPELRSIRDIG